MRPKIVRKNVCIASFSAGSNMYIAVLSSYWRYRWEIFFPTENIVSNERQAKWLC